MTYVVEVLAAGAVVAVTKVHVAVAVACVAAAAAAAVVVDDAVVVACDDDAALEAVEVALQFVLPSCWRGNRAT